MHDERIDDQLRRALRHDADALPMTITAAELDRRLDLRRRARHDRRLTVLAAGIGVVAIGAAAFGGGWLRLPAVGVTPTATPSASPTDRATPSPSQGASPSPAASPVRTPVPARVPPDLGTAHDPVVVRSVDEAGRRLLIVTVMESPERNLDVAQLPIPEGSELIDTEALVGPTGYLAIPSRPSVERSGVFVYDITDVDAPPLYFHASPSGFAWAPDGRLAIIVRDPAVDIVTIVDVADGAVLAEVTVPAGIVVAADGDGHGIWAADGSGLLAGRVGVAATERGILGTDGSFTPDPSPAVFAPTGRERLFGARGDALTVACGSSAEAPPDEACPLSVDQGGGRSDEIYRGDDVRDYLWTADGRAIWLATGDGDPLGIERVRLRRGIDPLEEIAVSTVDSGGVVSPQRLWGVSADDLVVALNGGLGPQEREPMTHVVDLETGEEWGLSGVFAGWASQADAVYDPPSP